MRKKQRLIKNERGSVLSVSLIVIALLSFSLSVVTGDTLNLTGQTTEVHENIQGTSYGKKILDMALEEMKEYILASSSSYPVTDYLTNKAPEIETNYGVVSTDVTSLEDLDPETQVAIKLSLALEDGITISRTTFYTFISDTNNNLTGSAAVAEILNDPENFDPNDPYEINFYFSLVTSGDFIMNGGYYNFPALYAANVFMHNRSPYVYDNNPADQSLTPANDHSDPLYKYDNFTKIFYDQNYKYCLDSGCITEGGASSNTIINKAAYQDVVGSGYASSGNPQDYKLDEFFEAFNYDENFLDFITNKAPTDDRTMIGTPTMDNYADLLLNSSNSETVTYDKNGKLIRPTTPYGDVTSNFSEFLGINSKDFSAIYDARTTGPLVLTNRLEMDEDETFIVLGDLTLDSIYANPANQNEHSVSGTLIVTGDLLVTGSSMSFRNTIIVLGKITFDFDEGHGLDNLKNGSNDTGQFSGLTILARDSIYFNSFFENHVAAPDDVLNLYAFMYTEQSVFIDAVNSHIRMEGAIYARARGNALNPLPYEDEEGNQINGIVINSYNGYISGTSNSPVPSLDPEAHGFHMTNLTVDKMQTEFDNLPRFEVKVRSDEYFVDDGYEVE